MNKSIFGETVYEYSSNQAQEDGILFDVTQVNESWKKGIFRFITTNLMNCGYLNEDGVNIPNLLDLLNQANQIVRKASNNFTKFDNFFCGNVELPDGELQKIFMALNELEKFTIMLPEDY